ncbi:MAG TPA: hypothetical protein VIJ42_07635 [Stellaceae bacterium]
MATPLRATIERATVDMAIVLASSPSTVEAEWLGLKLMSAEGDSGSITLTISREFLTTEPACVVRMTRNTTPGLFRRAAPIGAPAMWAFRGSTKDAIARGAIVGAWRAWSIARCWA